MSPKTVFITQAFLCVVMLFSTTGCQHLQLADNPMPIVSDDNQAIPMSKTPVNKTQKLKDKFKSNKPPKTQKKSTKQSLIYLLEDWF